MTDLHKQTILAVDDSATNLSIIAEYLEAHDFTVLVARDGESALEKAYHGRPDIILLDIMMPGIDGFETCRRLKADDITKEIPVIFVTALTNLEEKIKGFKVGAVDYVTKPIDQEELLARVSIHLRVRTLTQKLQQELIERKRAEAELTESEARFRQVVSSISDHIYVTEISEDGHHLNLYLSPHIELLSGYPTDNFVADWNFWPSTVIHPDDRSIAAAQAARLASGQSSQMEYRLVRADGQIIWVRDSGQVEKDTDRRSLITYGVVSDITERKQAEAKLADSEARYKAIATTVPGVIYQFTSRNGVWLVDYVAPQISEIFGLDAEDVLQDLNNFIKHIYPDDLPRFVTSVTAAVEHLTPWNYEGRLTNPQTGELVWWQGMSTPLATSSGEVIFNGILLNISERKQAEAELAVAHEQALEASRLKSELLANVSHDLRTPLTAILGYTDMLQVGVYGSLSHSQQTVTTRIMVNTQQLLFFINNMLDQAQIESGKLELRVSSFKPSDLIEAILSTMNVLAQSKGLELNSHIAPEIPDTLSGDFQRLQAVLLNLVSNAIKFTREGTIQISICRPDPDHWALQVADTGCGIPPAAQIYIFEPFRRVDGAITREQTGSGLGLSIVKRLTTLMGGQINLISAPEQGSTFTVLLPLISDGEAAS